jgi:RNA polymerase sigma factor (sigma-70 family)
MAVPHERELAEGARVVHVGTEDFESFFRAEHAGLFRALCLVTGSRQEAEDVMQVAFLRVFERWDRVAAMERPDGFLYRVAMNEFRSRYRRAARAAKRAITPGDPDDAFAEIDDRDEVVRALRDLVPQQRAAVVLTTMLGFPSEEAGELLGLSASSVRTLATRARKQLRASVEEEAR